MQKTNLKRITVIALSTAAVCLGAAMYFHFFGYKTSPEWSEAVAVSGEIGKMLCKYAELKGRDGNYPPSWQDLFEVAKLDYTVDEMLKNAYFKKECYSWEAAYDANLNPPIRFKITVVPPEGRKTEHIRQYKKITYDQNQVIERYE
jgi:hypothetical protein